MVTPPSEMDMDDEDPLPPTQPFDDPRRMGRNNSGLSERDLADIICILHPASSAAIQDVEMLAKDNPQHILQNEDLLGRSSPPDVLGSRDIALRLSAKVKDRSMGFKFGRNPQLCDVALGTKDPETRVSSRHFRIFLTEHGILMIQDMSKNGTLVDNVLLNYTNKEYHHSRTLSSGSVVTLGLLKDVEEQIKFFVRIPSREGYEDTYEDNVRNYHRLIADERERDKAQKGEGAMPNVGQPLFGDADTPPTAQAVRVNLANITRSRQKRAWAGGHKYNIVDEIGRGAFATVYKVTTKTNGEPYAAKELTRKNFLKSNVNDRSFETEMAIMKELHHRNIVQYIEHIMEADAMYIIMEYVPEGDLSRLIQGCGPLHEPTVQAIAWQTLQALNYLHQRKVTHRDIKPDNILIASLDPVYVKLSDFGLSKIVNEQTFLHTFCGTLLYCAPEVFSTYDQYRKDKKSKRQRAGNKSQTRSYTNACDIWSCAAVLFISLSGTPPYEAKSGDRELMLRKIMTTKLDVEPLLKQGVSDKGVAFIRRLLKPYAEERPTAEECLKDPWLAREAESAKESFGREDLGAPREIDQFPVGASRFSLEGGETREGEGVDEDEDEDDENDLDEPLYKGPQVTKRLKRDDAFEHGRERVEVPSSIDDSYSSLPHLASPGEPNAPHRHLQGQPGKGNRLFGEVGTSVLGSSGVISPNDLNLEGSAIGERDSGDGMSEASTLERVASPSSSDVYQEETRQIRNRTDHPAAARTVTSSQQNSSYLKEKISPPRVGAATSLFGAESLVGHLNFTSPSPRPSPTGETPTSPLTPKTQEASAHSSLHSSLGYTQMPEMETGSQDSTGRQTPPASKKFIRRINIPAPDSYYWKPEDKSTHTAEYAAMMRAKDEKAQKEKDIVVANEKRKQVKAPETNTRQMGGPVESGIDPTAQSKFTNGPTHGISSSAPAALPAPVGSRTSASEKEFVHPGQVFGTQVFGRLLSTPESSLSTTIPLRQRETSWGRGSENTMVYPNGQDVRIPKYAFDIIFFRKDLKVDLEQGIKWETLPDVKAYIKTRTTYKIWINDVPLVAWIDGKGSPFGELYSGDKITVWKDHPKSSSKKIEFVCEFTHGLSKPARPEGTKFKIIDAADFKFLKDKEDAENAASARGSQSQSPSPSVGFGGAGGSQSRPQSVVGGWRSPSPSQNSQHSVATSR
ncbi:MAG: hypothetical protein M1816_001135 [Peltula sp. TS41687]|nr:MAG: hypothetical protein M1816_001135 [Peltula sp. TS41687]